MTRGGPSHMMRLGILPSGYIYPPEQRAVRDLLRKRSTLVQQRTANFPSIQNPGAKEPRSQNLIE